MNERRAIAYQLYTQGKGYKAIARILSTTRSAVQMWKRRGRWSRPVSPSAQSDVSPSQYGGSLMHRGITWKDMPGPDHTAQRINFTLFRRGKHPLNAKCGDLEGPALIQRFKELNAYLVANGKKGGDWRKKSQQTKS